MAHPETFTFKKPSSPILTLQRHRAEASIVINEPDTVTVSLFIEGQQQGMTTDDRGAVGWDSPVLVDVSVSLGIAKDATLDTINAQSTEPAEGCEMFVYYWDHANITDFSAELTGMTDRHIAVTMTAQSGEGEVVFSGTLPVNHLRMETHEDYARAPLEAAAKTLLGLDSLPEWTHHPDFGYRAYTAL